MNNVISFPQIFDISTGKTMLKSGRESINQCIGLIVQTLVGELFGDPAFGSRVRALIYDKANDDLPELLKEEIIKQVATYEKRVYMTSNDINILYEDNKVTVSISYIETETGKRSALNIEVLRSE